MTPRRDGSERRLPALITGANGTIGRALIERFEATGWEVWGASRDPAAEDAATAEPGRRSIKLDLADDDDLPRVAESVCRSLRDGDHVSLVANASSRDALARDGSADAPTRLSFRQLLDVDVIGHYRLAAELASRAREASATASIVFMSSIYAVRGPHPIYPQGMEPVPAHYAAAKSAMIGLTRHAAATWGRDGIRVNCLVAGGVAAGQEPEFVDAYEARTPLGRMGTPEEIAAVAELLCGTSTSYVTGQVVAADGGWTAW